MLQNKEQKPIERRYYVYSILFVYTFFVWFPIMAFQSQRQTQKTQIQKAQNQQNHASSHQSMASLSFCRSLQLEQLFEKRLEWWSRIFEM